VKTLDGQEITRSERIAAKQVFARLRDELIAVREGKISKESVMKDNNAQPDSQPELEPPPETDDSNATGKQMTKHTPEERTKMYRELAEQKKVNTY